MSSPTRAAPLVPSAAQLRWQRQEVGMFVHFGLNTYFGVEWSDGTLPAEAFDPVDLDADQWVQVAQSFGARYVILTAKHHDGFCLWPTATTDYSVASSPWRGGRGDVVAELQAACARAGLTFGLYLSPWDRHEPSYPDPDAYDAFYAAQLRELCTRYGPLGELWFDGAGSDGRKYDWDGVMAIIDETQPDAVIFNMGRPTIRWVGNEDGLASDPVGYVTTSTDLNNYGSEQIVLGEERYLPPECDVSLRRGWFWAAEDEPKSVEHLLGIHYRSVGLGANLLLNVPPAADGLIGADDVERLAEWRAELDRRFGHPVPARLEQRDATHWTATFDPPVTLDHLRLREDFAAGQRVTRHAVRVGGAAGGATLASGQTIGQQRLHAFAPVEVGELAIELVGDAPRLVSVEGFDTGGASVPEIAYRAGTEAPE